MNSNINKRILLTTVFAAAAILSVVMLVTATGDTLMLTPVFAQDENMSSGRNYTEGNMTGSDMAGSGMATPPPLTP
jgi:signal transduction histidine kinase